MKRTTVLTLGTFLIFILMAATSCNKINDAIASHIPDMDWTQPDLTLTIPASTNTAQQTAWGTLKFDLNAYIQSNAPSGVQAGLSMAKHIYVTSVVATVLNGDANNNFQNLTFTTASSPALEFNTTPDPSTATVIGGGDMTTPPADPYTLTFPVTNNTDLKTHINGTDWVYIFAYKLNKPVTKDLQVNLKVNYKVSFSD